MDKNKNKRIKKYTAWACIVVLVALLAVMPLLAKSEDAADGPQASILSGSAERKDIRSVLIGGGTLAEEEALEITIPASVKLKEYLVSNGDRVNAGDPIASVDRVTVMSAISEVQATLDYLAEEIQSVSDEDISNKVTAQAGGLVKVIYAEVGDSVRDVMLEHGALAVLSLDGLMAVTVKTDADVAMGEIVCITLPDGTQIDGRVESCLDDVMVVTMEDDGYAIGETVQVTTREGRSIGSGEIYIHSPWNATAYAGTISVIHYSVGQTVYSGGTVMTLKDTGSTAEYEELSEQRREYEKLMLELFRMYQSEVITASGDGVVSGVDEYGTFLLSGKENQWTLSFLAGAPNGDDDTRYQNYVGQVFTVGTDGLVLNMNPQNLAITDYTDLSGVPTDPAAMTQSVIYNGSAPIYELSGGQWVQISGEAIGAGDVLLFAMDAEGNFVWVIRVARGTVPEEPSEPTEPEEPTAPTEPELPDTPTEPEATEPSEPEEPEGPSEPTGPDDDDPAEPSEPSDPDETPDTEKPGPSGPISYPQIGGGYQQGSAEPEYELYSLDTVTVASVTPQNTVKLEITVDELDISQIALGEEVAITVDALTGETFTAFVTAISNSGTNEGGNTKFTVELTMSHGENMYPGMNATATITVGTVGGALVVPVAALNEHGAETFLYTGFDEETGDLSDPVTVTLGASDGEYVQILSGLEEGDAFFYAYYDTLEISTAVEAGGFSFR